MSLVGPARYAPQLASGGNGALGIPPATAVLHHVALGPGETLLVAILAWSWPCWTKYAAFATVPAFEVTYRFWFFTHTVALPWGPKNDEVIMHAPFGRPGQLDVVCIARP